MSSQRIFKSKEAFSSFCDMAINSANLKSNYYSSKAGSDAFESYRNYFYANIYIDVAEILGKVKALYLEYSYAFDNGMGKTTILENASLLQNIVVALHNTEWSKSISYKSDYGNIENNLLEYKKAVDNLYQEYMKEPKAKEVFEDLKKRNQKAEQNTSNQRTL